MVGGKFDALADPPLVNAHLVISEVCGDVFKLFQVWNEYEDELRIKTAPFTGYHKQNKRKKVEDQCRGRFRGKLLVPLLRVLETAVGRSGEDKTSN